MALTDKLTAIGDAIRRKTGKSEPIPLSDMPEEIGKIETHTDEDLNIMGKLSGGYFNDRITSVRGGGLQSNKELTSVILPNVTHLSAWSLDSCINLERIDLTNINQISKDSIRNSKKLSALIIRNKNQVCNCTDVFYNTGISLGTGYIYVPAALVEQYKAAPNWSNFASQIRAIEDYPEITQAESAPKRTL